MMRSLKRFSLTAGAVAAVGVTTAALAGGGGYIATARSAKASAVASAPASFSVFDRSAVADDSDPQISALIANAGVDSTSIRRIGSSKTQLWAAYGADRVCVLAKSAIELHNVGACNPRAAIADGVLGWSQPSPTAPVPSDTTEVYALVPDGVTRVSFALLDGSNRDVAAENNGIAAVLPSPPAVERFVDADGVQHTVEFPKPIYNGAQR